MTNRRNASVGKQLRRHRLNPSCSRRSWLRGAVGAAVVGVASSPFTTSSRSSLAQDPFSQTLYIPDEIDRAVQKAIEFLVQTQRPDGAIADKSHEIAMTALAVMAMASVGVTPTPTTSQGNAMIKALNFVLQHNHQDIKGYFGDRDGSRMYGHGIITLMLTEMLGMGATPQQNQLIHEGLTNAIKLILAAQNVSKPEKLQGGWRYTPSSRDADLSVSVWQVMALRSAKNDGLDVPGEAIDAAVEYLKYSYTSPIGHDGVPRDKVSGFSYTPGSHHPTFTMTAAGLLAMQVCGNYDSPMVEGAAEWLMEHPPKVNERFFHYGIYYYAQGMHQVGGKYAKEADNIVPSTLLAAQRDNGSWQGRGGEEKNVGLVYATALSILSLSVRYHYLPIYQR
ncbi:hypothetical protein Pla22_35390 [Rubripirellula amarantea]|uniref:Prenyltransferase and squalene oxidase repeat protein n=1 Tax=Rubripirellula amarantea TaxID=2527999 RepID=A0A5C5WJ49_9BACT|nr:prenyltransferase/squalene oxidase repeat-containing protein [Rubripirellula amarantea]TWT50796.1 hypothetical protein Pla22_35390 [Rubripirellula amarantea]